MVGVLGLAGACSSSGGGSNADTTDFTSSSGGTSGGSGGAPEQDNCYRTGNLCECEDGDRGVYSCRDGEDVCNCNLCQQLDPEEFEFDACGGEPFGTWVLTDAETVVSKITFGRWETRQSTDECAAELELDDIDSLDFRLIFADGGDAEVYRSAQEGTYRYDAACAQAELGASCESTDWNGFDCTEEQCGVCSCPRLVSESSRTETWTWTRTETTVTIRGGTGDSWDYDYCVEDDQLQLVAEGLRLVFARAYTFSNPGPCADRGEAECYGGCERGRCVGDSDCEAASSEATCTNRQGCEWEAETCFGSPEACRLADYGNVPGCDFVETQPVCSGEREPCEDQTIESCEAVDGCEVSPGCVGGEVYCGVLYGACGACGNVTGCEPCADDFAVCVGSTTCEAQPRQSDCEGATYYEMGDCEWVDELCVGELPPCEELAPEECEDAPGCSLD